jgi:hypothetical protein
MTALFHAHSGIRYLVLAAGLLALLYFLIGTLRGKPFASPGPAILATFTGLVDLQVALGLLLYATGGRAAGIVGHLALMLLAVATLHATSIVRKRRPQPTGYGLPLLGVVIVAGLIVLGIVSIGRSVV